MKRALPGVFLLSCLGLALLGNPPRSDAQEKVSTSLAATLHPTSGFALARFGSSVAATNSVVAIGAFGDRSVSVYERNQGGANKWGLKSRLIAPDVDASFGDSVALSGTTLAVGAMNGGEGGLGAVFIFDRNRGGTGRWGLVKKIFGLEPLDFFGLAAVLDTDTLAVGAIATDSVYVFSRNRGGKNQWGLERVLTGPDGSNFGYSIAVSGNLVLVGTRLGDAAYLFGRNQGGANEWGLIKSLSPGESAPGFGKAVAISGTRAIVGAPDAGTGAVYLFTRNQGGSNQWGVVKKFAQFATSEFGRSVALSGDVLLIGARLASQEGLVGFFARNWTGPDAWGGFSGIYNDDGSFGGAVAIAGDTAVVGQNEEGSGAGHAFVFRINP